MKNEQQTLHTSRHLFMYANVASVFKYFIISHRHAFSMRLQIFNCTKSKISEALFALSNGSFIFPSIGDVCFIWKFNSHRLPFNFQCSTFNVHRNERGNTPDKWNIKLNWLNLKVKPNSITDCCWLWRKMFSIVKHEIAFVSWIFRILLFHLLFSNEILLWCDAGWFWSVGTQTKSFEHVTWKPK